jgi:hypothetical protein
LVVSYQLPPVNDTDFTDEIELLVRTSTLLLAVEEADVQHVSHSGKDVVIASF